MPDDQVPPTPPPNLNMHSPTGPQAPPDSIVVPDNATANTPTAAMQSTVNQPWELSKPKKPKKRLTIAAIAVVILILLVGGGAAGYRYYQVRVATEKFNALALKIKDQELITARNNVKASAIVNGIRPFLSPTTNGSLSKNAGTLLNNKADEISTLANQSCAAQASEVTPAVIDREMKGLALSATQRRYMSDMKQVLADLHDSPYANGTLCRDSKLVAAIARNLATLVPGLVLTENLPDNALPTSTQMNELKVYATKDMVDQATLQATLPESATFFADMHELLNDAYYTFLAAQNNDIGNAQQYLVKLNNVATRLDRDEKSANAEMANVGKKEDGATKKASQEEIAAIDYQRNHKVTNTNMQLDYAVPSFRIADAVINDYTVTHDGSFPYGSSIQALVSIDPAVKQLQTKNLLSNLSYQSLGSDQSGCSLNAKLADGSMLSEEYDPISTVT